MTTGTRRTIKAADRAFSDINPFWPPLAYRDCCDELALCDIEGPMGLDTNLPHCQRCEELSATDCVERLMANLGDEVYIAVSHDFYDEDNYELHVEIYSQYKEHYLKVANAISVAIGEPAFSGDWQDAAYPEWAVGEHVTVWKHNDAVMWLRLHHEDHECPIVIALAAHVA